MDEYNNLVGARMGVAFAAGGGTNGDALYELVLAAARGGELRVLEGGSPRASRATDVD